MFFIGIFGIEDKQKEIKTISGTACKNCNGEFELTLIKQYSFFHIFFIPLFRWNERYYLICNNCRTLYGIPEEKGKRAERGDDTAITYWDLKVIETEQDDYYIKQRCKNCGRTIEREFEYCPYCGSKR